MTTIMSLQAREKVAEALTSIVQEQEQRKKPAAVILAMTPEEAKELAETLLYPFPNPAVTLTAAEEPDEVECSVRRQATIYAKNTLGAYIPNADLAHILDRLDFLRHCLNEAYDRYEKQFGGFDTAEAPPLNEKGDFITQQLATRFVSARRHQRPIEEYAADIQANHLYLQRTASGEIPFDRVTALKNAIGIMANIPPEKVTVSAHLDKYTPDELCQGLEAIARAMGETPLTVDVTGVRVFEIYSSVLGEAVQATELQAEIETKPSNSADPS